MKYLKSIAALFEGFGPTHWVAFIVIVVMTLGIIISDIPLAANRIPGDTYSERIKALAHWHIAVPAFAGVIAGHWLWPGPIWLSGWQTISVLAICLITLLALDIAHEYWTLPFIAHLEKNPQEVFIVFFLVGHYVWSQGA